MQNMFKSFTVNFTFFLSFNALALTLVFALEFAKEFALEFATELFETFGLSKFALLFSNLFPIVSSLIFLIGEML